MKKNQLGAKMAARKMIGNFVAIDEIHKDHVKKEQVAHKNWQKNHGYMIDEIYKVRKIRDPRTRSDRCLVKYGKFFG